MYLRILIRDPQFPFVRFEPFLTGEDIVEFNQIDITELSFKTSFNIEQFRDVGYTTSSQIFIKDEFGKYRIPKTEESIVESKWFTMMQIDLNKFSKFIHPPRSTNQFQKIESEIIGITKEFIRNNRIDLIYSE